MKGSRTNRANLPSELSADPILRPCTGTSKMSFARTVSPTFDMNRVMSVHSDTEEALRAGMNTNVRSHSFLLLSQ